MPPPVLVSATTTLEALATELPGWVEGLIEHYWPGPLTIVCRQQPSLRWDLGETRGHRRRPDAGRRGRARAPRPHRPAGGLVGEHHRASRPRPTPTRPSGCWVSRSRWSWTTGRARAPPPRRSSTAPGSGRGSCARGRSAAEELAPVLEDLGTELEQPDDRPRRRPGRLTGGRAGPCVSTCSSSSSPASPATCCASSPASWRSGRAPWPGCATATCTPPRSPTSVAWRCSAASARDCSSPATCRS